MLQTCILVGFFMHPGSFWASFPCKFNFCAEEEGENSRHHQHQEPKTTFSGKLSKRLPPAPQWAQNRVFRCPTLENTRKNAGLRSQVQGKAHKNAGFTIITPRKPRKNAGQDHKTPLFTQ